MTVSSELRVGVAGATGALGKEIVAVLDRARWRPETLVALASRSTAVASVVYGGEDVAVDDLQQEALSDLDALVLAVPPEVAREVGERAIGEGVRVVDCSGAFTGDDDVPLVIPWVNPEALDTIGPRGLVAAPHPAATLLSAALGPLGRAGVEARAEATVLVPASIRGRAAIDELSRQVIAMFSSGTPPRKVFPDGLAFDLLPQWGELASDGWTTEESRVASEVECLAGGQPPTVALVGVPVFSGISAHVAVHGSRTVPPELARRILADGGVQVEDDESARAVPRPRRVEGRPLVHAGRIRADAQGGLHLWLSMDNLAVTAAVAVATCGLLVRSPR